MDKFDRVLQLQRIFHSHRQPVPLRVLAEKLECTERNARRLIDTYQDYTGANVEYDPEHRGWQLQGRDNERFELPGLWLTSEELRTLSLLLSLLGNLGNGLLNEELAGVEQYIHGLLARRGIRPSAFSERVRVVPVTHRQLPGSILQRVSEAVLNRRRLNIQYTDYARRRSQRTISPQTLVYYRENWYLDAWCHRKQELRTFAIARMQHPEILPDTAETIDRQQLKQHFSNSFGIFAGPATDTATLRFLPAVAHDIALQQWHPAQHGRWEGDDYILSVPYGDPRELLNDIMAHSPHVEVVAPVSLRKVLVARLERAAELYRAR